MNHDTPLSTAWLPALRAQARQAPRRPRLPLVVAGHTLGSVEDDVLGRLPGASALGLSRQLDERGPSWHLLADPSEAGVTAAFQPLALALRAAGRCGPWRNEQLAVVGAQGQRLGTIERGAVRVLAWPPRPCTWWAWRPMGVTGCSSAPTTNPTSPACGTR